MADVETEVGNGSKGDDFLTPAFPPGLFIEDGGEVIPVPSVQEEPPVPPVPPPRPTPAATQKPLPPAHQLKNTRRNLIVIAIIVVVVAAVVTALLVFQPWKSTTGIDQSYTDALSQYQQAQTALTQKITDAQALSSVQARVADPAVLDQLSSAISDAKSKVAPPPAEAENRRQIEDQTAQLTSQAQACNEAVTSLNDNMLAVAASRIQYATDQLNQAVASAQLVLDQSAGTADESARSALAIAISRTHAIINGLATADPSTFAATITEQQASLDQASQVVLGTQGMSCDGVEIPVGINPIVCQSMPAAAQQTMTSGGVETYAEFSMPSGNVGCTEDPNTDAVICEIINKTWTLPAELVAQCPSNGGSCLFVEAGIKDGAVTTIGHADPGLWVNNVGDPSMTVPTLAYGQVADFSPVACLSNEHGVVCWDTTTHHGFQMNSDWFLYW